MTHYSGSEHSIHIGCNHFRSQSVQGYFVFDNFFSSVICMDFEIGQNLDFLRLGQRRLGTSGMVRVDIKVVCIGPLSCLEVSGSV